MTNNPALDELLKQSAMNPAAKESISTMYDGDQGMFTSTDSQNIGYIPDLSKYEKYGVRYNVRSPFSSNIERADNQSRMEKFGNAIGRILPNVAYGLVGTVGAIGDLPDYFNSDEEVGNSLTEWANERKAALRESMPIYQRPDASFGSFSWWMNNGSDLVSSALEFGLAGGVIGRGVSSLKWLNALTKGKNAIAIGEGAAALNEGLSAGSKFWTGSRILQAQKLDNLAKTFTTAYALNQAESIASAVEVYKDAETRALDMGASPDRAKELASIAATNTISANRINVALNMTSAARFLKTPDAIRESIKSRSWALKQALKPDKNVESMWREIGKEGFQEYAEEVINLRSEQLGKEAAMHDFQTDTSGGSLRSLYDAANPIKFLNAALTKEGVEAGVLGFLGGAGQTAIQTEVLDRLPGKLFGEKVAKLDEKGNIIYKEEQATYREDTQMRANEKIFMPVTKSDGTVIEASVENPYTVTEKDLLENPSAFVHKAGEKAFTQKGEVINIRGDIDYEEDGKYLSKRKAEKIRYSQAQSMENYMRNTSKRVYDSLVSAQRQAQAASAVEAIDKLNDRTSNSQDREDALDAIAMYMASRSSSTDSNDVDSITEAAKKAKEELSNYSIADFEKIRDEARQESLSELAWNAFNASTTESLVEMFKDIQKLSPEEALQQGYSKDYVEQAQKAIDRIEQLKEVYIEYTNKYDSAQAKDLFDNRAKDIVMFDSLKDLRSRRDKLKSDIEARAVIRNSSQQSAEQFKKAMDIDDAEANELKALDDEEKAIREEIKKVKITLEEGAITDTSSDREILDKVVHANRQKNRELGVLYKKLDNIDKKRVNVQSKYDTQRADEGILDTHDLIKLKESNKSIASVLRKINDNDQDFVIMRDRKQKKTRRDPLNRDIRRQLIFDATIQELYSLQENGTHTITFSDTVVGSDVNTIARYIANQIYDEKYLGKVAEEKSWVDDKNPELLELLDKLLDEHTFIFSEEEMAAWKDTTAGDSQNDRAKAKTIEILRDMVTKGKATINIERLASLGMNGEISPIANDPTKWSFSPKLQDDIELTEEELDFYQNATYPQTTDKIYEIKEVRPGLYRANIANPDYKIIITSKDFQGLNAIPKEVIGIRDSMDNALRFAGNRTARIQSHIKSITRELNDMKPEQEEAMSQLNDAMSVSKSAYDEIYNALMSAATGLEYNPETDISDLTAEQLIQMSKINDEMKDIEGLHLRKVIDSANDRIESIADLIDNAIASSINLEAAIILLQNEDDIAPEDLSQAISDINFRQRMLTRNINSLRSQLAKAVNDRETLLKYKGVDKEGLEKALLYKQNTISNYESLITILQNQSDEITKSVRSLRSSLRNMISSGENTEAYVQKYLENQAEVERLYDKLANRGLISIPDSSAIDEMLPYLTSSANFLESIANNPLDSQKLADEYIKISERAEEQFNHYVEEQELLLSKFRYLNESLRSNTGNMSEASIMEELRYVTKRLDVINTAVDIVADLAVMKEKIHFLRNTPVPTEAQARRNAAVLRIKAQELRSQAVNLELSKEDIKRLEELEMSRNQYRKILSENPGPNSVSTTKSAIQSAVKHLEYINRISNSTHEAINKELSKADTQFLLTVENDLKKLSKSQKRKYRSISSRKRDATISDLTLGASNVGNFSFNSLKESLKLAESTIETMSDRVRSLDDRITASKKMLSVMDNIDKLSSYHDSDSITSDAEIIKQDLEHFADSIDKLKDLRDQYEEVINVISSRADFDNITPYFTSKVSKGLEELFGNLIEGFEDLNPGQKADALKSLINNSPAGTQYLLNEISSYLGTLSTQARQIRDIMSATQLIYSDILANPISQQAAKNDAKDSKTWEQLQPVQQNPPPTESIEDIVSGAIYDTEIKTGQIGKTINPEITYHPEEGKDGVTYMVTSPNENGIPQFTNSKQVVDFHHATMLVSRPHVVDGVPVTSLSEVKGKIVKASDPIVSGIIASSTTHSFSNQQVDRLSSRGLSIDDTGRIYVSDKNKLAKFIDNYASFIADRTELNKIKSIPQGDKTGEVGRITIAQLDLLFRYTPEDFGRETAEINGKSEKITGEGMFLIYTNSKGTPYRFDYGTETISTTSGDIAVAPLVAPTSSFLYQFKNTIARYITGTNTTWSFLTKDMKDDQVLQATIDGKKVDIPVGLVKRMTDTLVASPEASDFEKSLKNTIDIAIKNEIRTMRENYDKAIKNNTGDPVSLNFSAGIPLTSTISRPLSSVIKKEEVQDYDIVTTSVGGVVSRPSFGDATWFTPNSKRLGAVAILTNKGEEINVTARNINDAEADFIMQMIKLDFGTYIRELPTSVKMVSKVKDPSGKDVDLGKSMSLIMTDGQSERLIDKLILWGKYKDGEHQKNAIYVEKVDNRNYLFYGDKKVKISELFQDNAASHSKQQEIKEFLKTLPLNIKVPASKNAPYFLPTNVQYSSITGDITVTGQQYGNVVDMIFGSDAMVTNSITREDSKRAGGRGFLVASRYPYFSQTPKVIPTTPVVPPPVSSEEGRPAVIENVLSIGQAIKKYPGKQIILQDVNVTDPATNGIYNIDYYISVDKGKVTVTKVEATGPNPERAAQLSERLPGVVSSNKLIPNFFTTGVLFRMNNANSAEASALGDLIDINTQLPPNEIKVKVVVSEAIAPKKKEVTINKLEDLAGELPEAHVELMDALAKDWRTIPITLNDKGNFLARLSSADIRNIEIGNKFKTSTNKANILLHEFIHTISLRRALSYYKGKSKVPTDVQSGFDAARLAVILDRDLDYKMMYLLMGEEFAKAAQTEEGKKVIADFKGKAKDKALNVDTLYQEMSAATNNNKITAGYHDFREIISGILSEDDFVKILNDIQVDYKGSKSSLFDIIKSAIMKMFGYDIEPGSAAEVTLNTALKVIKEKDNVPPIGPQEKIQKVNPNEGVVEDLDSVGEAEDEFPDFGNNSLISSYPEEPLSEEESLVSEIYNIDPTYPGKLADAIRDFTVSPSTKLVDNIITYLGFDPNSIKSKHEGSTPFDAVVLELLRDGIIDDSNRQAMLKSASFFNKLSVFRDIIYDSDNESFTKQRLRESYAKLNVSQPHSITMVELLQANIPEEHMTAFLDGLTTLMMESIVTKNPDVIENLLGKSLTGINRYYNEAYDKALYTLEQFIEEIKPSVNKTTLKYYQSTYDELSKPEVKQSIIKYHASTELRSSGIIVQDIEPENSTSDTQTSEEQPKGLFEDQGAISVKETASPIIKWMLGSITKMGFRGGEANAAQIKFAENNIPILASYISDLRSKSLIEFNDSLNQDKLIRFLQSQRIGEYAMRFLEGDDSVGAIQDMIQTLTTIKGRMEFVKSTNLLGEFVPLRNSLGLPTPENFGRMWNYLAREMSVAIPDYDSFIQTLNGVVSKESRRRSDAMYGITQISNLLEKFSDVSDPLALSVRNSFVQAFTKYQMLHTVTIVTPDGDIYSIDANSDRDSKRIRTAWRTNFYGKIREYNNNKGITGTLKLHKDYLEELSAKLLTSNPSTEKQVIAEILEAFGISLSDFETTYTNFPLQNKRDLRKVTEDILKYAAVFVTSGVEPDIYSTVAGEGIAYTLTQLINYEAESTNNPSSPQFMSADNETVYAISNHHFMSTTAVVLNSTRANWRTKLPHLDNSYARSSVILKNTTSGGDLQIVALNGMTSSLPGETGEITAKIPGADRLKQSISETLMFGTYKIPQAADRKVTNGFRLYNPDGSRRMLFNSKIEGVNLFVNYFLDEFHTVNSGAGKDLMRYNSVKDYRFFSFISKDLKNRFKEFYNILLSEDRVFSYEQLVSKDPVLYKALREEIESYFDRKSSKLTKLLKSQGLLERTPKIEGDRSTFEDVITVAGVGKVPGIVGVSRELFLKYYNDAGRDYTKAVEALVLDYVMHQEAGYIETTKIFSGDPANYGNSDEFFKRMSMLNSPRKISVTGASITSILNAHSNAYFLNEDGSRDRKLTQDEVKEFLSGVVFNKRVFLESGFRPDGKKGDRDIIKTSILDDVITKAAIAVDDVTSVAVSTTGIKYFNKKKEEVEPSILRKSYTEYLVGLGITNPNTLVLNVSAYLKPYLDIKATDSAAFISLSEYRELMLRSGDGWKAAHEEAYIKAITGRKLSAKEMFLFQPQKTSYVGPLVDNDASDDVFALGIYKHVVAPLIPAAIKGTVLEDVDKWMTDTQTGIVQFLSGNKSGTTVRKGSKPPSFYKDGKLNTAEWSNSQQNISYMYYGVQVDNAPKFKGETVAGSQPRKNILADIFEYGSPSEELSAAANGYVSMQNLIIRRKFSDMLNKLKATDGRITDRQALVTRLLEQAEVSGEPINVRRSIAALADSKNPIFIEEVLSSKRVENIMMALIRNIIIKEKRKGENFAQFTSVGSEKKSVEGSESLEFYRRGHDGSVIPAQAMIPLPKEWNGVSGWDVNTVNDKLDALHAKLDNIRIEGLEGTLTDEESHLLKLTTLVGYRIPNQLLGSSDVFEVRRFLPTEVGSIAYVPAGLVAKVGGDFDFDKLISMLPNFRTTKKSVKYYDFDNPDVFLEYGKYRSRFIKELAQRDPSFADKIKQSKIFSKDKKAVIDSLTAIQDQLADDGFEDSMSMYLLDDLIDQFSVPLDEMVKVDILSSMLDLFDEDFVEMAGEVFELIEDMRELEVSIDQDLRDANMLNLENFTSYLASENFREEYLGQPYLQNKIREYQQDILTHPSNFATFMRPVSSALMTDINIGVVWDIRFLQSDSAELKAFMGEKRDIVSKNKKVKEKIDASYDKWKKAYVDSYKSQATSFNEVFDIVNNHNKFEYFLVGKFLIGVVARNITSHTLTEMANVYMNYPLVVTENGFNDNSNMFFPINWVDEKGQKFPYDPYSLTKKEDGYYDGDTKVLSFGDMLFPSLASSTSTDGNNIIDILSTYLNAYVDVAKDPYIFDINAGKIVSRVNMLLTRLGTPLSTATRFTNQTIIKKFLDNQSRNESQVRKAMSIDLTKDGVVMQTLAELPGSKYPKFLSSDEFYAIESAKRRGVFNILGKKRGRSGFVEDYSSYVNAYSRFASSNLKMLYIRKDKAFKDKPIDSIYNDSLNNYIEYNRQNVAIRKPDDDIRKYDAMRLNGLFSFEKLGDYLVDEPSAELQTAMLDLFLEYQRQAKQLTSALNATSHDTFGTAKTMYDMAEYLYQTAEVVAENTFINLSNIHDNTMISSFVNVVNASVPLFNPLYLFGAGSTEYNIASEMMNIIGKVHGMEKTEGLIKKILEEYKGFIIHANLGTGKHVDTTKVYNTILTSGRYKLPDNRRVGITQYINYIQSYKGKSEKLNRLRRNAFIRYLEADDVANALPGELFFSTIAHRNRADHPTLGIVNKMITSKEKDQLTNAFREIKSIDEGLFEDLITVCLAQYGTSTHPRSYYDLIPDEEYREIYHDQFARYNELRDNDETFLGKFVGQFYDQFFARHPNYLPKYNNYVSTNDENYEECKIFNTNEASKIPYVVKYRIFKDEAGRNRAAYVLYKRVVIGRASYYNTLAQSGHRLGYLGYNFDIRNAYKFGELLSDPDVPSDNSQDINDIVSPENDTMKKPIVSNRMIPTSSPSLHQGKMTYAYGNNKREGLQAASTFDAVLSGERTHTTRYDSDGNVEYWTEPSIGDIILWENDNRKSAYTNVTYPMDHLFPRESYSGDRNAANTPDGVFVFGSNPLGINGKGAALAAVNEFGVIKNEVMDNRLSNSGKAYGLVTVNGPRDYISLDQIQDNISKLYGVAARNPSRKFYIAYDGKDPNSVSLNGKTKLELAKAFANAGEVKGHIPSNIVFEKDFHNLVLDEYAKVWSEVEGWSVDYFNEKVRPRLDEAWGISFALPANIKPSTPTSSVSGSTTPESTKSSQEGLEWLKSSYTLKKDGSEVIFASYIPGTAYLSNFYRLNVPIVDDMGISYDTVEAYYQAAKSANKADRERIAALTDAAEVRTEGRKLSTRPDFESTKYDTMKEALFQKFSKNPELADKLRATGDKTLVHAVYWQGGADWGVFTSEGKTGFTGRATNTGTNALGKIMMEVRSKLPSTDVRSTTSSSHNVKKVISGLQTGIDELGLEVAKSLGYKTGGTTTIDFGQENRKSGKVSADLYGVTAITDDLQKDYESRYPNHNQGQRYYNARTERNVIDSDGTVYFATDEDSAGRISTERFATNHNKPFILNPTAEELSSWLRVNNVNVLNVAGNRGSKVTPEFAENARKVLTNALGIYNEEKSGYPDATDIISVWKQDSQECIS